MRRELQPAGYSSRTIDVDESQVQRFFHRTCRSPNPADSIPVPRQSRKYPYNLSKEKVFELLGALSNIKHRFLLSLAYSGGLRVSEVVRLKVADLDFDRALSV